MTKERAGAWSSSHVLGERVEGGGGVTEEETSPIFGLVTCPCGWWHGGLKGGGSVVSLKKRVVENYA